MDYCCINFKIAIAEDNIKLIDSYERYKSGQDWTQETAKIPKGFYIIDGYMDGEMSLENYPAKPITRLKHCPYCGAKLLTF